MPLRIDSKRRRVDVPPSANEAPFVLVRATANAAPSVGDAARKAVEAPTRLAADALTRADTERPGLLGKLARDLGLPAVTTHTLSAKLEKVGDTLQVGVGLPGRMELFGPNHVSRSPDGSGSYVKMTREMGGGSSYSTFYVDLANAPGIFLAVIYVGGSVKELNIEAGVYGLDALITAKNVKRSGDKFLVPFEVPGPSSGMDFGMYIPEGTFGDLMVYLVEVTRVK